ncbi:hypothetical protein MATL_G00196870 [Megalops atlanticus]|uniref:Uncharacterized protein n=1 Tax=Megalops atlanticus TaxID=7932 RepID=A0A9D3PLN0_MEGAT|nr:hypothetical protein MATL_G00196870 [Megalops atlanticus]
MCQCFYRFRGHAHWSGEWCSPECQSCAKIQPFSLSPPRDSPALLPALPYLVMGLCPAHKVLGGINVGANSREGFRESGTWTPWQDTGLGLSWWAPFSGPAAWHYRPSATSTPRHCVSTGGSTTPWGRCGWRAGVSSVPVCTPWASAAVRWCSVRWTSRHGARFEWRRRRAR